MRRMMTITAPTLPHATFASREALLDYLRDFGADEDESAEGEPVLYIAAADVDYLLAA
jgi:hypothetical protein